MKKVFLLSLFALCLSGCSKTEFSDTFIGFGGASIVIKTYEGEQQYTEELSGILQTLSLETDNYLESDLANVYTINHSNNQPVTISSQLYDVLKKSYEAQYEIDSYFNMFIGSLSKKWKTALENNTVLSDEVIDSELNKLENADLNFLDKNQVQLVGECEIDLGATAKGYALDIAKDYFKNKGITQYMVNAGSSSILLGEKDKNGSPFSVRIKDLGNKYIEAKNCVVSTSSIFEQKYTINSQTYSHIFNPETGEATPINDLVIVISNNGLIGDALSTTMMMASIPEIESFEHYFSVQSIIVRDNAVVHCHQSLVII